ncbi:MAG: hypothetical protein COA61_009020 [Zetaproteobacteria bacterium]|nr:hypothetical protein [Zetaproteobacteria bacterium]
MSLLLVLESKLGKLHTTIQEVFGIFMDGLMLFCGGLVLLRPHHSFNWKEKIHLGETNMKNRLETMTIKTA